MLRYDTADKPRNSFPFNKTLPLESPQVRKSLKFTFLHFLHTQTV